MILGSHRTDFATVFPLDIVLNKVTDTNNFNIRSKGDIAIGNDVWIGSNVIILPGVTIGDGAVIGAGSIVTKNVEPYAIVVGNPTRMIKKRFDDQKIASFLELKWWNWDIQKIEENITLLLSTDIDALLKKNQML
jgi:acetyltransferase-like isoleucine patch superfamily enzyme